MIADIGQSGVIQTTVAVQSSSEYEYKKHLFRILIWLLTTGNQGKSGSVLVIYHLAHAEKFTWFIPKK